VSTLRSATAVQNAAGGLAASGARRYPLDVRVLIAPDKFKGTLTASAAARAIASGWRRARPGDKLALLPISDGGDGFGSVMAELRGANPMRALARDAAGRRCRVPWWWDAARRTAIVESARVIGLAMLPPGRYHPFELDTHGLGQTLGAAAERGARRCLVGIGGSATNDGGFGLAVALGWRFLDRRGRETRHWMDLAKLERIEPPHERIWPRQIIVAVDVQNRLLGARGCTRVYGPQKGLRAADFARAEAALGRLAEVAGWQFGRNYAAEPGAGAAGGLGFGLAVFTGAELTPGFDLVAREVRLESQLRRADLVLTGEGRLDGSTLMGKGVGELAARCREAGVPCLALGGEASQRRTLGHHFASVAALTDFVSREEALAQPGVWLRKLAEKAGREFQS
jgi:glycerate kinase